MCQLWSIPLEIFHGVDCFHVYIIIMLPFTYFDVL